jgi:glucan phosphoethanolaminetransferase (alkaline phosphatase superfamily)
MPTSHIILFVIILALMLIPAWETIFKVAFLAFFLVPAVAIFLFYVIGIFVIAPTLPSPAQRHDAELNAMRQNYHPSPEVNQMLNTQSIQRPHEATFEERWSDGYVAPDHIELGKPLPKPTPTPEPRSNPQPRGKTTFALS